MGADLGGLELMELQPMINQGVSAGSRNVADFTALQQLQWLLNAKVRKLLPLLCGADSVCQHFVKCPWGYVICTSDQQVCCVQGVGSNYLEQLPEIVHELWYRWHLASASGRHSMLTGSALGSMVTEALDVGSRVSLAGRTAKSLQLRLAARHVARCTPITTTGSLQNSDHAEAIASKSLLKVSGDWCMRFRLPHD